MPSTPLQTLCPKLPPGILYGGDYNPEQWPEEIWQEDVALMREAGVNLVSIAIFSWAKLEPRDGHFDFGWLDRVIALLWANRVSVCLATATASPPAWLSRAHPESLPVDRSGVRCSPGARQHYCPNSRAYRALGARLIGKIARRYARHPAVALWHVNNEVGCHSYECFCEVCAQEFRLWLKKRYRSLDELNESWGTAFWSQAYGEWEEILPPRKMLTFRNPGQVLDYARFMSDSLRDLIAGEVSAIRAIDPEARVTTNALPFHRPADYWSWYREVDVAAWDSYPDPVHGLVAVAGAAFNHDLFRSLRGGQPFILMEQATTQVNWRPINRLKAPGQMRALSLAALARGADGIMFFQWRASRAGAEKYHSAMVPHFGTAQSRVFGEVKALGEELQRLRAVAGSRVRARVGLVVSWENRWALEIESKPASFDYEAIVQHFYRPLWAENIAVDVLHPDAPLADYAVVVVPALYQMTAAQAKSFGDFTRQGGTLIATYFTGVVDEREHVWLGGYPALLRDVLGIAVEEWQPLVPGESNALRADGVDATCEDFCEILHLHGAEVVATFTRDFFAGRAAVTRNTFGRGEAFYIATRPSGEWLRGFFRGILKQRGIESPLAAGEGVEVMVRNHDDREYLFVINHTPEPASVDFGDRVGRDLLTGDSLTGRSSIEPFGVRVIERA